MARRRRKHWVTRTRSPWDHYTNLGRRQRGEQALGRKMYRAVQRVLFGTRGDRLKGYTVTRRRRRSAR
jgi:hypothetical protein